jgi:uracil phosphoribosyltransferase
MSNVHLIDHPLVQHKLTLMRKKDQHQQLPPPAQ